LSGGGLAALEAQVRRDLALTAFPEPEWVPPTTAPDGSPALDVLIVGAGQGGLAVAALLLRERVTNILVIDRAPAGGEGIWRSYARMETLRTSKTVTGPDLGLPSLTYQAWHEAQHGAAAFAAMGKIAKELWHDYLRWLRDVLGIPVQNDAELLALRPAAGLIAAELRAGGRLRILYARKVVLAMGIETSGRWWMPEPVAALPERLRAHTADPIDFEALRGKRVAVLGAGASAFDNAATALEHGAVVTLFCRRPELQRVQPYKAISYAGFLRHLGALDDSLRWRFMNYLLTIREALPAETWERTTRHAAFTLVTGAPWETVEAVDDVVRIATPKGRFEADFVICGTGFEMDLTCRPELAGFAHRIATWADRYTPPAGEANERLGRYPYLGDALQFTEKEVGTAPFLGELHCFNFGATMSFGPSGSSINGMKFAVPRLVAGITRDLFSRDAPHHLERLLAYDTPEFPPIFARDRPAAAE
jgi:cation diffusion facilitator CzcD-associated flavoprotein CzcO